MKINTENNTILVEKVFNPITLRSESGEEIIICMRDSGFEFNYEGVNYEAKNGILKEITSKSENNNSDPQSPGPNPVEYIISEFNSKFPNSIFLVNREEKNECLNLKFEISRLSIQNIERESILVYLKSVTSTAFNGCYVEVFEIMDFNFSSNAIFVISIKLK